MLGWSLNLFRVRGIQLSVHGSFFLLLAWIANEGWEADRFAGMGVSVGLLVAFFCCVVLHELGHSFTAMHYGIGVRRILLMPIGGMAEFNAIPREPMREFLITLAGPAVNFTIVGLLAPFVGFPQGLPWHPEFADGWAELGQILLYWNLVMGCFNLLPVFPMDGGRILRAILAARMPYLRATYVAATIGKILAVIAGLIFVLVYHRYLTGILFAFIFFAGDTEYRAVRRRETEDARWREMLAQYYSKPPENEPPLLSP